MPVSELILVSRGSPLALQQSNWVKAELERRVAGLLVKIVKVRTTGDRMRSQPLPQIGGKGLFTREIEEALLAGRAHLAVHSLKDLPTELPPELILAAVPQREDPRDALVSREGREGKKLAELPRSARVGTSSIRRTAQLRRLRPDLVIEPLRGNLGTRLRKLREGNLDAIVLAAAGLRRMGFEDQITEYFEEETLCPAVGQGALGIEARAGDEAILRALAVLEDPAARLAVTAERALLAHLGGGCQIPIAALARCEQGEIRLAAMVISPDGCQLVNTVESVPLAAMDKANQAALDTAEALGKKAAENLLQQGAGKILEAVAATQESLPSPQAP
ncbi:MAG: hydroxymethylbilane synthase [Acidobacteria bacterium]|nr:hydroxymethylbilane synthase [Acidobacteriota bacterium]